MNIPLRPTAGPISADPLQVAFYSLSGTETILDDTGYIAKKDLEEFHSGWFRVSNCRTELTRWLFDCKTGFVNSTYVQLTEYQRIFLRAEETKTKPLQESSQHTTTDTPVHSENRISGDNGEERPISPLEMSVSEDSRELNTDKSNEYINHSSCFCLSFGYKGGLSKKGLATSGMM